MKELNKEQKTTILKDLWSKRNPSHDYDSDGVDRFWGTVICIFEDYEEALQKPFGEKRFLALNHYPGMRHKVGDTIILPSEEWKDLDGTYFDEDYFRRYPDYFKEV